MRNRNNNSSSGRPVARRAEQFTNFPVVKEPMELMDFFVQMKMEKIDIITSRLVNVFSIK